MNTTAKKTRDGVRQGQVRAKISAVLLAAAVLVGAWFTFVPFFSHETEKETVETTPRVTVIPARPSAAPTATPTITGMKLLTYGTELTEDGFTTYVGDKAVVLTLKLEPEMKRPPVYWSVSDSESASLVVGEDRTSCEFTALKPTGKNSLTVTCYGAELTIPVYLWQR